VATGDRVSAVDHVLRQVVIPDSEVFLLRHVSRTKDALPGGVGKPPGRMAATSDHRELISAAAE
jgi:hypothetical protein